MAEEIFLSVVIPAHNEEHRLPSTLRRLQEFLPTQGYTFEVIIVENGSRDGTRGVVERARPGFAQLRLISMPQAGKGGAVRAGMLAARGAFRFMCDADLSMPIEEVGRFLPPRVEAEVAIASREAQGARRFGEPAYRHLMGRVFAQAVKLIVLRGFEDTQCGFKCYRARAAQDVFSRQVLQGWTFDVEDLFLARRLGYSIVDVPIPWYYQAESRVQVAADSLRMLADLVRIRVNWMRGVYDISRPSPSQSAL
ncbi:MAG: glycosyl transferase [Chloroflexi bacterium RBG_16_64_43]|nr:MAG: glycosyl transferase [Chloroflexi bacterium RBG_16_64_43]